MKILIIEDETEAAKHLTWLLQKIEPTAAIVGTIESVSDGIAWLNTEPMPDLIVSDIQLADGISFGIFEQVRVTCPVIFTTAYDAYALRAFEVHSIDYLLKPISETALRGAVEKYKSLTNNVLHQFSERLGNLIQQNKQNTPPQYRRSFLVRFREKMLPVKTESFAYFFTKNELVYGCVTDGTLYNIENTLEELENSLDPTLFFRANRQFIVNREAINEVEFYFNGRLSIKTQPLAAEKILVSKERVPVFRRWFEGQ
jgi:two-component system, LytTR family, response regulator LytT